VASRLDAPGFGAEAQAFALDHRWQGSVSWRYQRSFRHFVGASEQIDREEERSQVINRIHVMDVSLRYDLTPRTSISLSVPFLMADRSSPIRDESDEVIARSITSARGLSDIVVAGRRWMWEPADERMGNVQLGLGAKLPTGSNNVIDTRTTFRDSVFVTNIQTVDQSIQPGDGGFGFLVDATGWRRLGGITAYVSGSYLFNPQNTSGVLTYRSRATESVMSIADQYVLRAGLGMTVPGARALSMSAGVRVEGVPSEDLLGESDGFRRPGYAVSIEPSIHYAFGPSAVTIAVPVAVHRNRVKSVADLAEDRHGDAAFADYLILTGLSHRF
jgi:hypothetical protein